MIHGMDGKKLSKRHGATAVGDYQHQGLLPGAMLNFLALLGWSPGGDREVMTLDEMIELFGVEGLQKKAAIFDPKKLEWMNGQHLVDDSAGGARAARHAAHRRGGTGVGRGARGSPGMVFSAARPAARARRGRWTTSSARQVPTFSRDRIRSGGGRQELEGSGGGGISCCARPARRSPPRQPGRRRHWRPRYGALAEARGIAAGKVFQPLRVALTGLTVSPGIFEMLIQMGRELSLSRIDAARCGAERVHTEATEENR